MRVACAVTVRSSVSLAPSRGGKPRGENQLVRMRTSAKSIVVIVAAAVVVSVAAYAWLTLAPRHVPAGQPPLSTLNGGSMPAFQAASNAPKGKAPFSPCLPRTHPFEANPWGTRA